MKYISEFRNGTVAKGLAQEIAEAAQNADSMCFMEVCGTHTMAIHRYGIKKLLPENITLISGPGCPVCVTPNQYIDRAVAYSRIADVIVCTFGDMVRVPGSSSSLEREKAQGADVRIVYSPLDAVEIAQKNPNKKVIFMGVGFETTVPTIAAAVATAEKLKVNNFFLSSAHKTMPQALLALVQEENIDLHGFILPAHVSTIIGLKPYEFLAEQYNQACVITGFEPLDILLGLLMLVRQKISKAVNVEIQYKRVVRQEGNPKAIRLIDKIFEPCNSEWRGIGVIQGSGLRLRSKYQQYNAEENFEVAVEAIKENKACICGDILRGLQTPVECTLFAEVCTPENPIGACMVSNEGTCAAYYKYDGNKRK